MPHGAVDLGVSRQLHESYGSSANLHFFSYLLLLLGSAALFVALPLVAIVTFLLVSGLHFALADARALQRSVSFEAGPQLVWAAALVRGSLLISLPFFFFPAESISVFSNVAAVVGASSPDIDPAMVRLWSGVLVAISVIGHVAVTSCRLAAGQISTASTELVEASVLCFAFISLHPLFAIGTYVLLWHGWRHLHSLY
jgi:Brp/Blh family beta-carotene 15,15'-monooxygenase